MATKTKRKSTGTKVTTSGEGSAARSRRLRSRSADGGSGALVWSEASITVQISENPSSFIKFGHGFEMMSRDFTPEAIAATEKEIFEACEIVVNKRARKLKKILREMKEE